MERLIRFNSVYNIKRKMASLPPLSVQEFAEQMPATTSGPNDSAAFAKSSVPEAAEALENMDLNENTEAEEVDVNRCLFCNEQSTTLEGNLEHMSSAHGLYIPELEHLASVETFVQYLSSVVNHYHECIFCGMAKHSAKGIQQHMLDKGHSMINLEREPELLDFWDFSDGEDESDAEAESVDKARPRFLAADSSTVPLRKISEGTLLLPSGKIVGSQNEGRERTSSRRSANSAAGQMIVRGPRNAEASSEGEPSNTSQPSQPSRDRRLAVRGAMGLVGVSDQQKRSLMVTQKKMQKQEAVTRAATAWATERVVNKQKYYRVRSHSTLLLVY
jgi:pre-60S factor REI1